MKHEEKAKIICLCRPVWREKEKKGERFVEETFAVPATPSETVFFLITSFDVSQKNKPTKIGAKKSFDVSNCDSTNIDLLKRHLQCQQRPQKLSFISNQFWCYQLRLYQEGFKCDHCDMNLSQAASDDSHKDKKGNCKWSVAKRFGTVIILMISTYGCTTI